MKHLTKFLAYLLLKIPSFRKPKDNWGGRFENGGKEPGAAVTHEVKFEVY